LKVLFVNLAVKLAALNFANVFLNKKRLENKKTLKNVKNVTKINKTLKKRFYIYGFSGVSVSRFKVVVDVLCFERR